jgi:hypothetical protein
MVEARDGRVEVLPQLGRTAATRARAELVWRLGALGTGHRTPSEPERRRVHANGRLGRGSLPERSEATNETLVWRSQSVGAHSRAPLVLCLLEVWILTAADNGLGRFRLAAATTTASNGSWSARLPAGPSRLVEAVYPGGPTTEPSSSGQVNLVVPAKVELLNISPSAVAWAGTVRITGLLAGGYLPPKGALVRLRIGLGKSFTTYGVHEHITGNGRFTTSYTFGAGEPSVRRLFWFQIGSLPVGDYPYAPAESQRRFVRVGGHPWLLRRTSRR